MCGIRRSRRKGSTPAGKSAKNDSSRTRPEGRIEDTRIYTNHNCLKTQARKSRRVRAYRASRWETALSIPICARFRSTINAQVFEEISPKATRCTRAEMLVQSFLHSCFVSRVNALRWIRNGGAARPMDSVCRSSSTRRTPCMLMRSYSSVTVVSSAVSDGRAPTAAHEAPSRCLFRRSSKIGPLPACVSHSWWVVYFTPTRNSRPSAGSPGHPDISYQRDWRCGRRS